MLKYPTYNADMATIASDMVDNNDAALMNIAANDTRQWLKTKGTMGMGYFPRGDNVPYWWGDVAKNEWTAGVEFTTNTRPWEAITPWYVVSKGVSHTATNTAVNIGGVSIQLFDTSVNAWRKIDIGGGNLTWSTNKDYSNNGTVDVGSATKTIESDGSWSLQFISNASAIHGGVLRYALSDTIADYNNIGGVFVALNAKLVLIDPNGVDDRDDAQILVCVGADYWPTTTISTATMGISWLPNVGISRFRLVGNNSTKYHLAAISPPGVQANISTYVIGGGITTMPVATLNTYIPPYIP